MTQAPDDPHDPAITELFDEFVALQEGEGSGDVDALLERAGERAESLRERIHVYGLLREMGDLIAGDFGAESGDDEEGPAPERLGRFEIVRPIGEGGLSRVFLAWDSVLERELAIKVMRTSAQAKGRDSWIVSEGRKLARLKHDSIVRVLDVGEYEGRAYVAMEYVAGPTLAEVLDALSAGRDDRPGSAPEPGSRAALARAAAARLATPAARSAFVLRIAEALAYCHEQGIVHRDIKPGNVLIDASGTPKLIDFGLARLDADESLFVTDRLIGTPAYLAPEQVDNERTGASTASDQFSLGVLLYELLTLENPFARKGRSETMTAISRAAVKSPRKLDRDIPIDLERICLHCLERSPERRYASIAGLVDDLRAFLGHRAISLQAPSPARQLGLLIRRHQSQVTVGAAAFLAVVTLFAILTIASERSKRSTVLDWIDDHRAQVTDYDLPREFEVTLEGISERRKLAGEYDTALFSDVLWPRLTPRLDELWNVTAARFEDTLAPVFEDAHRNLDYAWRARRYETADVLWRNAIALLRLSSPDQDAHNRFLPIGFVDVPENGTLERYSTDLPALPPGLPRLVEVQAGPLLLPGMYRFTREEDGALLQTEFPVSPLMPRLRVEVQPVEPDTRQGLVDVDGVARDFPGSPFDPTPVPYAIEDFRILREPVTWADVRRVFGAELDTILQRQELGAIRETDPALLFWCEANEYARRVHARLPTPPELWQALRTGKIEAPRPDDVDGDGEIDGVRFVREWVSTSLQLDRRYAIRYDELRLDPPQPFSWGGVPQIDNDSVPSVCFRVALSR